MPIPTDPFLGLQWHLGNTGGLLDLRVRNVWNPTAGGPAYTGAGVRVIVVDDGFDFTHTDLAPNYDTGLDFDFEFNTLSAFGFANQPHGTAVAGIIGADNNGTGAVGVAFDASLVGYRTANLISDAWLQDVRDAIHHGAVTALGDVINISQGIANDTNSEFGVGYAAVRFDEIETSIGTAVNQGRGGLGTTIVKSAGNSRAASYDVNADDWTNDTRQVVVAAVDQNGFVSSYSSYGAAVLVSGFGTPGDVVTTDRVGAAGYTSGDFTTFNGTSAAAPMVSGVVALIYDANAGLGWRDVQSILANSARHVGSNVGAGVAGSERYAWTFNGADTWNGGGLHFSNDYGYGLVDATAAVRLAESWLLGIPAQTTANQFTNVMDVLNVATVIPDANATGLTFSGNAVFNDEVDRVTVQMTFSTTFTGDLELFVTSPSGTVSRLIDNAGGGNDFNGTWTFESQAFRGERAAGTWSVRVADTIGGDVLTVSDIVVRTWGRDSINDRYVYTDEYTTYAGLFGHSTILTDINGGTDVVNAAAVSTDSTINLTSGVVGSIAGRAFSIAGTNIENAVGGDGNDTIIGNILNNQLAGGRGNDTIDGVSGLDSAVYFGLRASYILSMLDGIHRVTGPEGFDTLFNIDQLIFSNTTLAIPLDDYVQTAATLGVLPLNGSTTGNLELPGDHDWFRYSLFDGWTYTFDLEGLATGAGTLADPYLRLYDSGGTLLAFNDDAGVGFNSLLQYASTGSTGAFIDAGAFADFGAGSYTVRARESLTNINGGFNGDFNGNGLADILFRHANGDIAMWQTNTAATLLGSAPLEWDLNALGDFNGNNRDDILFRHTNGDIAAWQVNTAGQLSTVQLLGSTAPVWQVNGIGDFNGNGRDDILFRHASNGDIAAWGTDANGNLNSVQLLGSAPTAWRIVGIGDFDANGRSDILFRNVDGGIAAWGTNAQGQLSSVRFLGSTGTDWHVVGTGDFDANGRDDILFRNNNNAIAVWETNANGDLVSATQIGTTTSAWHIFGTGDFNGNGQDDILFRNDDGSVAAWQNNSAPQVIGSVTSAWNIGVLSMDFV